MYLSPIIYLTWKKHSGTIEIFDYSIPVEQNLSLQGRFTSLLPAPIWHSWFQMSSSPSCLPTSWLHDLNPCTHLSLSIRIWDSSNVVFYFTQKREAFRRTFPCDLINSIYQSTFFCIHKLSFSLIPWETVFIFSIHTVHLNIMWHK